MKKLFVLTLLLCCSFIHLYSQSPTYSSVPTFPDSCFNFIIVNDLGRNGYYEQKNIAALMGSVAEQSKIKFVAAAGDTHHFNGVQSVSDPLWMTNYELIYDHPDLMIDWYAVSGNHEYRGSTQAVLDYADVSRRWIAPDRYFTRTFTLGDEITCLLVFIDTTPLINKYRNDPETYPDAVKQDDVRQLEWINSVLANSTATWKVVIGHHPVYAETPKSFDEREDLQQRLEPILNANKVDLYFCGHIHNFQHIHSSLGEVEYVVNSSASLSRPVSPIEGTLYCSSDPGFTVCSVEEDQFVFSFINHKGEVIYKYSKTK